MLLKGRPVPDELKPLSMSIYDDFLGQIYTMNVLGEIRAFLGKVIPDWASLSPDQKIQILSRCQDILFDTLIPTPACQLTFGRVRFSATFHPTDWSIRFSQNYFNRPFHQTFKTWLHESYHGLLHFLSLRLNTAQGEKVVHPPAHISQTARQYPLPPNQSSARILAERNLLGMIDRYLTQTERHWAGLDSYYLNVEILVENLTEYSFRRILPNMPYSRSYRTAEEYIQLRLSGTPPIKAAS